MAKIFSTEDLMAAVHDNIDAMCQNAGQYTLGKVRDILKSVDGGFRVVIDGQYNPGELHSYRGYYRFAAIDTQQESVTAEELLIDVSSIIDTHLTGYKGGEYLMTELTPLWFSEYGEASALGLTSHSIDEESGTVNFSVFKY